MVTCPPIGIYRLYSRVANRSWEEITRLERQADLAGSQPVVRPWSPVEEPLPAEVLWQRLSSAWTIRDTDQVSLLTQVRGIVGRARHRLESGHPDGAQRSVSLEAPATGGGPPSGRVMRRGLSIPPELLRKRRREKGETDPIPSTGCCSLGPRITGREV